MKAESANDRVRPGLLLVLAGFFAAGVGTGALFTSGRIKGEIDELRLESDAIKRELASHDDILFAMRNDLRRFDWSFDTRVFGQVESIGSTDSHLLELWRTQSNTLALVEALMDRSNFALYEAAVPNRQARQWAVQQLQDSVTEQEQQIRRGTEQLQALFQALQVPIEVDQLPPESGLQRAELSNYWPFFEAKRELDILRRTGDALRLRLVQETIEMNLQP